MTSYIDMSYKNTFLTFLVIILHWGCGFPVRNLEIQSYGFSRTQQNKVAIITVCIVIIMYCHVSECIIWSSIVLRLVFAAQLSTVTCLRSCACSSFRLCPLLFTVVSTSGHLVLAVLLLSDTDTMHTKASLFCKPQADKTKEQGDVQNCEKAKGQTISRQTDLA